MSYELRGTTTLKEDMEINRSKYVETNIGFVRRLSVWKEVIMWM